MTNPLAGHTAASGFTNADGLKDGDTITSPSLTSLYGAIHGNGIIRGEDFAIGASNRNAVGATTPGHVSVTSGGVVTVQGGYVAIDGAIYDFANGPGSSASFTIGTTANYQGSGGSAPTLAGLPFSANTDVWVAIYVASNSANNNLMYELGTPANSLTNTPLTPSTFLSDPHISGTFSNHQHVMLATVRMTIAASASAIPAGFNASEVHDKRCYYRQTPIFFTQGTGGALGSETAANAIDGANNKTLDNIYSGVEAGNLSTSPFGAMWQSYSPVNANKAGTTVNSKLFYSAKMGSTRHTHRLGPNEVEIDKPKAATATITFSGNVTEDQTIVIISTDGTSRTYTAKNSPTTASLQFDANGGAAANATSLKSAIEHSNGHTTSKITVADDSSGTLTLTQVTLGSAGNTTITENLTNVTASAYFSGGESVQADTCTFDGPNIFFKDPTNGALTLNPNGTFPNGHIIEIKNAATSGSNTVTFDTTGLNHALSNGQYGKFIYHGASSAATATITLSGNVTEDQTITIISTNGTSRTYTAKNSPTTASLQFDANGGAAANATSLKAAIEHANGHGGGSPLISVADSGAGVLTLTQTAAGAAGNTTITENCTNLAKTDFTGGHDGWRTCVEHPLGDITGVVAGVGLSGGGTSGDVTLTLDLSELGTVTPANGDFLSTLDSDGSTEQKTEVSALATLFAGDGLTAASAVMAVGAGNLIDVQANQVDVDLSEAAAAVMAEADEFIFLDNDDSSAAKRESFSDLLDTIAGTVATTGLDRSGATLVVSDLHPVGVDGSANQLLTDDGDGTVTSESNLTFDGSTLAVTGALTTTTTATVGTDLTVTGGDIGFGNGQDATVSVAATTSTTAGRDLTISAGSTSTNGNNIDGGDLVLKSGGGDGTGTSIMAFHTKVSGTDTAAERMRIHTNGNVGIGEAAPSAKLHIMQDTQNTNGLLVEEDTATATASPDVVLYKSKGTGASDRSAANDDLGHFKFRGTDDAGNTCDYADMFAECGDPSNGAEGGYLNLRVASRHNSGGTRTLLRLRSNSGNDEVVVNDAPYNNCNFRVEGATDTNLFQTDAANDRIGISTSSPKNIL